MDEDAATQATKEEEDPQLLKSFDLNRWIVTSSKISLDLALLSKEQEGAAEKVCTLIHFFEHGVRERFQTKLLKERGFKWLHIMLKREFIDAATILIRLLDNIGVLPTLFVNSRKELISLADVDGYFLIIF